MSAVQSAHEILLHRDTTANFYKIWWITTLNATDPDSLLGEGLSHVALSMIVLNVRGHSLSKPTCSTHVCKFQSPFVELLELFGVTPSQVQNFSENSIEDWWRLPGRRLSYITAVWYPTSMQILAGLHSSIRWFRGGSKMCTWCEKWHYSNISIYIYIWPEVKEVKKWQDVFWEYSLDSIRNRFSNIS